MFVLRVLEENQLFVNIKKCDFGRLEVAYLGHVISSKGVAVDRDKVQAKLEWEEPKTIRELRGFLDLTGYYQKFIKPNAHFARPLSEQLKKDCFGWTQEAMAFVQLKNAMLVLLCLLCLILANLLCSKLMHLDSTSLLF